MDESSTAPAAEAGAAAPAEETPAVDTDAPVAVAVAADATAEAEAPAPSTGGGTAVPVEDDDDDELFGSSDDDDNGEAAAAPVATAAAADKLDEEDLFGSSGDEDGDGDGGLKMAVDATPAEAAADNDEPGAAATEAVPKSKAKQIFEDSDEELVADEVQEDDVVQEAQEELPDEEVEAVKPMFVQNIGTDLNYVKMPNFLSIQSKPFDAATHEAEYDVETYDDVGRQRVKLKSGATVRWRWATDENGELKKDAHGEKVPETNARMVKWSDGSESLVLGNKVVDIRKKDMTQEHQCLFNFGQADTGMDAVETFDSRMILQLSDASSKNPFHKAILGRAAVNAGKRQKIQMYSSIENPEEALEKRLKEDKEMEKARVMREAKSRRVREGGHSRKMTKSYLEEGYEKGSDNDSVVGEDEDESLDAIKAGYKKKKASRKKKKGKKKAKGGRNSDSEDDAADEEVADDEDNKFIDDADDDVEESADESADDAAEDGDDAADSNGDSEEDVDDAADDGDDADGEGKGSKRSRVVSDSEDDDDDQDAESESAPKKRSKAVISDDEDDE